MIRTLSVITLFALITTLTACGTQDDSSLTGSKKKYFVVACDGAVFDNNDPFGRRVTLMQEGTKQFKKTSDFVLTNETTEWRQVMTTLSGACLGGANKIPGFNGNICGMINAFDPTLGFNLVETTFNGVVYKGSWSCNLKEKQK